METVAKLVVAAVIVVMAAAGVLQFMNGTAAAYEQSDETAQDVSADLVAANTAFSLDLFKQLAADTSENVFISPLSVSTALAMTYAGTNGTTQEEMARTLHLESFSEAMVSREYEELIQSLEHVDQDVTLRIGNSVWVEEAFAPAVHPGYTRRLKQRYDSDVFTRDFSNDRTVDDINSWVEEETEGMIPKMMNRIPSETVLFLLNAVYFKGIWRTQFDPDDTDPEPFHAPAGEVEVQMMETEGNFSYYQTADLEVARLPYGRNKMAMYVLLPAENSSLSALTRRLDRGTLTTYLSHVKPHDDLTVKLPRFKVEYGKKRLNDALKTLGMSSAFNQQEANLSGIASMSGGQNLYVQFVDHKAVIRVNEEGTEAAAATNVGIALTSATPSPRFVANRPFLFLIRDDRSNTVLFMGQVTNPPALD